MRLSCNKNYIARRKNAENIRTDKNKLFREIHAKRKVKHNYSLINIAPAFVVLHYLCVCVCAVRAGVFVCACVLARCSCVRYSHDKSVVRRRRTTTTIMSQMQVTLYTCICTHIHMYVHICIPTMYARLYMQWCLCIVHVCIEHTYTKFLNNYKNCAVPSVIVVSVRANDVAPFLSHPQDNSVHSCWRLFTPRERE